MYNMSRVYRPQRGICRAPLLARATLMKTTVSDQSSADALICVDAKKSSAMCWAVFRDGCDNEEKLGGSYKKEEEILNGVRTAAKATVPANTPTENGSKYWSKNLCYNRYLLKMCHLPGVHWFERSLCCAPPVGTCFIWIVCVCTLRLWVKSRPAPLAGGSICRWDPGLVNLWILQEKEEGV